MSRIDVDFVLLGICVLLGFPIFAVLVIGVWWMLFDVVQRVFL